MKLKKILAVFLACCLSLSFLIIPVSASSPLNLERNTIRFISELSNNFNDYKSGALSLSEFFESVGISVARYNINFYSDATSFSKLLKELENIGIPVSDSWHDWYYQKMGGDGGGGHRDDSILDGYGAVCICYNGNNDLEFTCYSAYGIIYKQLTNQIVAYADDEKIVHRVFSSGSVNNSNDRQVLGYLDKSFSSNIYVFYGDWRYDDGSDASDVVEELPEKEIPPFDDDSVPEDDLEDFLDDLLEKLQNENPDTSTIEGLLRSILSKLDTLDKDDDSVLLSQILTAIEALKKEEEKTEEDPAEEEEKKETDLSVLLALLQELRDSLIYVDPNDDTVSTVALMLHKMLENQLTTEDLHDYFVYEDDETSLTVAEMLHDIQKNQITIKNFEIDESLFNQRFSLVQAKLLGKFSFISEVKAFVEYAIDSYANTSSCPSISLTLFGSTHYLDFSAFDEHIDLIRWCVAAFFYLSFAFSIFRKIPGYINGGDNT